MGAMGMGHKQGNKKGGKHYWVVSLIANEHWHKSGPFMCGFVGLYSLVTWACPSDNLLTSINRWYEPRLLP